MIPNLLHSRLFRVTFQNQDLREVRTSNIRQKAKKKRKVQDRYRYEMTGIRITLTRIRMSFDPSIATITALYRCQGMKNPTIACSPTLLADPKRETKDDTGSGLSMQLGLGSVCGQPIPGPGRSTRGRPMEARPDMACFGSSAELSPHRAKQETNSPFINYIHSGV